MQWLLLKCIASIPAWWKTLTFADQSWQVNGKLGMWPPINALVIVSIKWCHPIRIWPFLICSVASTGMTDSVGFNCHIMDWSWARYWLDNSSDIIPEKTSNIYVKGCLRNCKIFSALNYLHELSWTKTETNCVTVAGDFKGEPCVFPVRSLVSTMGEETSILPLSFWYFWIDHFQHLNMTK